jgi:hypothetical protein
VIIEVSSYVDIYTRFQYYTLSRHLILGISVYPKLCACWYIGSLLTWYLSFKVLSAPPVVTTLFPHDVHNKMNYALSQRLILVISIPRVWWGFGYAHRGIKLWWCIYSISVFYPFQTTHTRYCYIPQVICLQVYWLSPHLVFGFERDIGTSGMRRPGFLTIVIVRCIMSFPSIYRYRY